MLLDANGRPISSPNLKQEKLSRATELQNACIDVLTERKATLDEMADVIANLFNNWALALPFDTYAEHTSLVLQHLAKCQEANTVAKLAEKKIAMGNSAANPS